MHHIKMMIKYFCLKIINSSYEYSRAAKPILDLTANLILTPEERNEISSKYNDSKELIKHLKNETILFYFNNYRPEKQIQEN
ncbi:hypothetical protein [Rickettsia rhipicephali]|uniref:hypothetical protein n=1 Tax=Rickettsia rhipicephali TaxID=33992 RepID=UPI000A427D43|nr:hypothetical protein [Rickettsia rhipicephali]